MIGNDSSTAATVLSSQGDFKGVAAWRGAHPFIWGLMDRQGLVTPQ
jgi:hypothetical protein